ncbi:hypothetical protein TNCV_2208791 [Trichonephila clavipes]|nr:hypothetical protein TNCV_2208791 [Trichonephila clavipes]
MNDLRDSLLYPTETGRVDNGKQGHPREGSSQRNKEQGVLVAALWDKKLAFRTRERRKFWVFYGRTATQGEKDIFGSRAAIEFSLGEGERPAQRSNISIVFTATVSEGIAIFGSRAAIQFSFGEKEHPAQRRSN